MTAWPRWRTDDPAALSRYVQVGVAAQLLPPELASRLPTPGPAPRLDRAKAVYEILAAAGIRYEPESAATIPAEQEIRPPDQVLHRPRVATCVDLALVYAGMCLDAGLHPLIARCEPSRAGDPGHAVVIVWLGGDRGSDGPAVNYPLRERIEWGVRGDLVESPGGPGAYLAVDVTGAAGGGTRRASWADAVAAGARVIAGADDRWRWTSTADVGATHTRAAALPMPYWPQRDVLGAPYHAPYPQAGPLTRLQARRRRNEFQSRDELKALEQFCTAHQDPGQAVPRLAILHGSGGAGKTHLAAELADRLAATGWEAGFLDSPASPDDLRWLAGVASPLLVVLDHADAAPAAVLELVHGLAGRAATTCVVLTARGLGDWWTTQLAEELAGVGFTSTNIGLPVRHPHSDRVFRRALRAFGLAAARADTVDPPPGDWSTLDVVMQAWLRAHGITDQPGSAAELYDQLLAVEFQYWRMVAKNGGLREPAEPVLRAAGAVLSLLAPRADRVAVALTSVPALSADRPYAEQLAALITQLLPAEGGRFAIRPDNVGEHLMLAELDKRRRSASLMERAVTAADDDERATAVAALTRAAAADEDKARLLADEALQAVPELREPALNAALGQGGPFAATLVELAGADETPKPLAQIARRIPPGHQSRRPLAQAAPPPVEPVAQRKPPVKAEIKDRTRARGEVTGEAKGEAEGAAEAQVAAQVEDSTPVAAPVKPPVEAPVKPEPSVYAGRLIDAAVRLEDSGARAAALDDAARAVEARRRSGPRGDLAEALNTLGVQLARAGRQEEALSSTDEALAIRRSLADADPAYLPALAASLTTSGNVLGETGRHADALAAAAEAVGLHRQLNTESPALATALACLGTHLVAVGRHDESVAASQEAVAQFRALPSAAHLPGLAGALLGLGAVLSGIGRDAEALPLTVEAAGYFQQLAAADSAYLSRLATAMSNLGAQFAKTGRRADALAPTEEAVAIDRRLAEAHPDVYLPGLARSLVNLGNRLSEAGRNREAVAPSEEAVTHFRRLAAGDPAYLAGLATALSNVGIRLGDAGRVVDALGPTEEAVACFRQLAAASPAYVPGLAGVLTNLGAQLGRAGRAADAVPYAEEAVVHYGRLVTTNPGFVPNLAGSLSNIGNHMATLGRNGEALAYTEEAVRHYRQLAETNPAAHLPDLANALDELAIRLAAAGRHPDAVSSAREAVAVARSLVERNPAFRPDLARSLTNLGNQLAGAGQPAAAAAPAHEAVTILRPLLETHPEAYLPLLAAAVGNVGTQLGAIGRHTEAVPFAEEAVDIRRRLAQAHPDAYLVDLAGSLDSLAVQLSEDGRQVEALAAAEEAVEILRRLAEGEGARHAADLARSLSTLRAQLGEAGRHAEAMGPASEAVTTFRRLADGNDAYLPDLAAALTDVGEHLAEGGQHDVAVAPAAEAVEIYRGLAAADPAAHLSDLALSMGNLANWLDAAGRTAEVAGHYERAVAELSPGPASALLVQRSARHLVDGLGGELRRDFLRARSLAQDETEPVRAAHARAVVRAFVGTYPTELRDLIGADVVRGWPTADLPADVVEVIRQWLAARGWPAREVVLRQDTVRRPAFRDGLALARFLSPGVAELDQLREALDDIAERGLDQVVAERRDADAHAHAIQEWLNTATWKESLEFARDSSDLRLGDPATVARLLAGGGDPMRARHAAIAALTASMPLTEVYDAVTDPEHAADLAVQRLEDGDAHAATLLVAACPGAEGAGFLGRFVAALRVALSPADDADARAAIAEAALAGTELERSTGAVRLQTIAAALPARADMLADLADTFDRASTLGEWVDTTTWDQSLAFAGRHPELLTDDDVIRWLGADAADPVRKRHIAIAGLSRSFPLDVVYRAVRDPAFAADLALQAGDPTVSGLLAAASPGMHETPFVGELVGAVSLVLAGEEAFDPVQLVRGAVRSGTAEQRAAARVRLEAIAEANPAHAPRIRELVAVLDERGPDDN